MKVEDLYENGRVPQSSLRDIYYILFRHKKKALIFFFVVALTVALGTYLTPEFYKSDAQLLVKVGRESVALDPTITTGQIITVSQPREYEINSELEILKSREVAEMVVEAIGTDAIMKRHDKDTLDNTSAIGVAWDVISKTGQKVRFALVKIDQPVPERKESDEALLRLMKNLDINVKKNSNIISLSYKTWDPKLAQDVLTKIIDFYLEKHIEVHRTTGSYKFFIEQSNQVREKLAQSEESLRELKNRTSIASLNEQRTIILERIGTLQQEMEETEADLATSKSKAQELQRILVNLPERVEIERTAGVDNMAYGYMRNALYNLQLMEQDLLSKYTEESLQVKEIRRQIAEAQALLNKEEPTHTQVKQSLNAEYQQVRLDLFAEKATLSSFEGKIKALKKLLADGQDELKALNNSETQIVRLQREMAIQEDTYQKYVDNLEQARIDQALQMEKISNIGVVQQASFPINPSGPNKMVNLILGLFFGVLGGIGLTFFSEYIDHSLKTQEDIEKKLNLQTLVVIPKRPEKTNSKFNDKFEDIREGIKERVH